MLARDFMTSPVLTATPDATILDVVRLMLDNRISAVPIVSTAGELIGIVSEGDLIRRSEIGARDYSSWWLAALAGKARLAEDFVKTHAMKANEIMSRDVVSVATATPIWQIAETLEKRKIKRVPVLDDDGKVVGIVSRANLLQALAAQSERVQAPPSSDDRELRDSILKLLEGQAWSDLTHLNVVVLDGIVHFWGVVSSEAEREGLKVAAENVPGVKGVTDHTTKSLTLI